MRRRVWVLLVSAALVCAGCSAQASSEPAGGESLAIGVADGFTSYNTQSAAGRTETNLAVLNAVAPGFWYSSPSGEAVPDTAIGSYRKLSDDPLRVRYDFAPSARWSDGDPLDCDDAILAWMANNRGFAGFESADASGYSLISAVECAMGQSTFTVEYSQPYADWETLFGSLLPAHIAEQESGVPDVIAAAATRDAASVQALARFWNSGWDVPARGTAHVDLMPSAGPYRIAEIESGAVVLVPNGRWWGTVPKAPRVEFAPGGDTVGALATGAVDALETTPTAAALRDLQRAGLTYRVGSSFAFDSLVFNVAGAQFATAENRRAFAACVPREQIIADLYQDLDPSATALTGSLLLPFQPGYGDVEAVSLPPERVQAQTVRLRGDGSARGSAIIALVKAGCAPYGFDVVAADDAGWDAAVIRTQGSPRITAAAARFASGATGNIGGYQSQAADDLLYVLATTPGRTQQLALALQLETILWQDLPVLPLSAAPTLAAWRPGVTGVELNPAPGGLTWNLEDWG